MQDSFQLFASGCLFYRHCQHLLSRRLYDKRFQSIYFYRTGFLLSSLCYLAASIFVDFRAEWDTGAVHINGLYFNLYPHPLLPHVSFFYQDAVFRRMDRRCLPGRYQSILATGGQTKDYKLTPAEIEVCSLLLDGYTLRQISVMVSKAYATINTYCTSIYRKLNINSRVELLLLLQEYKK